MTPDSLHEGWQTTASRLHATREVYLRIRLRHFIWSQAFLNKGYLLTYKYRQNNVLHEPATKFSGHFVK